MIIAKGLSLLGICGLGVFLASHASAAEYHVNGRGAIKPGDGSVTQPFRTIQEACDRVTVGDTIIVAPGVYREHVQLTSAGSKDAPITIRADKVQPGRVVITGANSEIQAKKIRWKLEDKTLQLYSVPLDFKPARVLYDNVDLLPYPSLNSLKVFRMGTYPGTLHGFAFDEANKRLYVRLHPSGRYGSLDPNQHTMAVSPPNGGGWAGHAISKPEHYNIGVLVDGDAHVVIDGFTFETPGVAGVYTRGNYVTVRNSWFPGCRTAVAGKAEAPEAEKTSNHVTVEHCDFGPYPGFNDMVEVMWRYRDDPLRNQDGRNRIFWWQRKGDQPEGMGIGYQNTYELGLASMIGQNWTIRHNEVHDGLDGLSCWSLRWSTNLEVYGNRFYRCIDNAVESEDHAKNLKVHDNLIVDTFEPFSWQPLGGTPWPGPVYIYRNVVWSSPEFTEIFRYISGYPGVVKLGAVDRNWQDARMSEVSKDEVRAAGEGFNFFNNTIYQPISRFFTRVQPEERMFSNFRFYNNVWVGAQVDAKTHFDGRSMELNGNIGVALDRKRPDQGALKSFGGIMGKTVEDVEALGLEDPSAMKFDLKANSPARNIAARMMLTGVAPEILNSTDAGAVPYGQTWQAPVTGPRIEK